MRPSPIPRTSYRSLEGEECSYVAGSEMVNTDPRPTSLTTSSFANARMSLMSPSRNRPAFLMRSTSFSCAAFSGPVLP